MCLSRKHVEYLERSNEDDYQQRRVSYETYVRFCDITQRCQECDLLDNGTHGDILGDCRLHLLRLFISMKRDAEQTAKTRQAGLDPLQATAVKP